MTIALRIRRFDWPCYKAHFDRRGVSYDPVPDPSGVFIDVGLAGRPDAMLAKLSVHRPSRVLGA